MKIVNSNGKYMVFSDDLKTYDKLPAGTYNIVFSKMSGFSLLERSNVEEQNEKIYGNYIPKIEKTMRSFELSKKNFGVMLSGDKGMGKSMFSRMLSLEAIKRDIPVIIVDNYVPGISNFISSIEQEVMIMFDEFDKTFKKEGGDSNFDPQEELLTLLDGFDNGKKLFVMTCNNLWNINEFLVNRPGRVHYHFRFSYPSIDEIKEYFKDKLSEDDYNKNISSIISFASKIEISYDMLKAIAFEINNSYTFKESIEDLNMLNSDGVTYDIFVEFSDGTCSEACHEVDLFKNSFYIRCNKEDRTNDSIRDIRKEDTRMGTTFLTIKASNPTIENYKDGIRISSGFSIESDVDYSVKSVFLKKKETNTYKYTV